MTGNESESVNLFFKLTLMTKLPRALVLLLCLLTFACQTDVATPQKKASAKALNISDVEYFTKTYKAGMEVKDGFSLKECYSKLSSEAYQGQPAEYGFKAWEIMRDGSSSASGILIEFKTDRLKTSLMGAAKRKKNAFYYVVPSANAASTLHESFKKNFEALGFKDNEVFIAHFGRLLSELYL